MSKFTELQHSVEKEGYSKKVAGAIAYKAGERKYGKKGMARKAAAGRKRHKK